MTIEERVAKLEEQILLLEHNIGALMIWVRETRDKLTDEGICSFEWQPPEPENFNPFDPKRN